MEQTLGKRIMQYRKSLGLTQEQLAEKLGVTAQAVSKWENDQSCPDISMIPKLAGIFKITTDTLLGNEPSETVHQGEVVEENIQDQDGIHIQNGTWEFHYDNSKKSALGFALLVLAVGSQLLMGKILLKDLSFWEILWPTALFVWGVFGCLSSFSFFHIGCLLVGGYFMLDNWKLLPFTMSSDLVFPAIVILFGVSLLVAALKKPNNPRFRFLHKDRKSADYQVNGDRFVFEASFGDTDQLVSMPRLAYGKISTSFGDYDIDLREVEELTDDCHLDISCSFGELTLYVPRRYAVKPVTSTSFAEFSVEGHPDSTPAGIINVKANVSFGEITIEYI